jgi:hypothetical protein
MFRGHVKKSLLLPQLAPKIKGFLNNYQTNPPENIFLNRGLDIFILVIILFRYL